MEIAPEIYAWLTSLNIIDPFKSLQEEDFTRHFSIPKKTLYLFLAGKYFDIILTKLQDAYNKYYKVKMNYIKVIEKMKPVEENQEYISYNIKYANWQIISQILNTFGLSYTEDILTKIVNNYKDEFYKVIKDIYNLLYKLTKGYTNSINNTNTNSNSNTINNTNNNITIYSKYNNINNNRTINTKNFILSRSNNNKRHEQTKESKIESNESISNVIYNINNNRSNYMHNVNNNNIKLR